MSDSASVNSGGDGPALTTTTTKTMTRTKSMIVPARRASTSDVKTSTTPSASSSTSPSNIQVAVRCRPLNHDEKKDAQATAVTVDLDTNNVKLSYGTGKKINRSIEFDRVFGMYSRQNEVYDSMVKPIVEEAMSGFNCTVFAYGPTGTGKTHTMEGDISDEAEWGMIPRAAKTMFDSLNASGCDYTVKVSFLEICKNASHPLNSIYHLLRFSIT
jgi:hypothetical protein